MAITTKTTLFLIVGAMLLASPCMGTAVDVPTWEGNDLVLGLLRGAQSASGATAQSQATVSGAPPSVVSGITQRPSIVSGISNIISAIPKAPKPSIKKVIHSAIALKVAKESTEKLLGLLQRLADAGNEKAEHVVEVAESVEELKDNVLRALVGDKIVNKISGVHAAADSFVDSKLSLGRKAISGVIDHLG